MICEACEDKFESFKCPVCKAVQTMFCRECHNEMIHNVIVHPKSQINGDGWDHLEPRQREKKV